MFSLLTDIAVPSDQNIVKKVEKLSKYKDFEMEVFKMSGMNVKNNTWT